MTGHCPRCCPYRFQGFDPVRTPKDLRQVRAAAYTAAAFLFLAACLLAMSVGHDGVVYGLYAVVALLVLVGHGQTTILRVQRDHLRGHRSR